MKKKILLLGGGGHAKVVADAIRKSGNFIISGIVDAKLPVGASACGIKVLGNDSQLKSLFHKGIKQAFIGIGSIGDCSIRKRADQFLKSIGFTMPVIRHPSAIIGDDVELGEGAFVAAGVVINPGTRIGRHAIINTSSSIDHDCVIGDFVHIAPGVTLSGGVKVGDEAHIGIGASIVQNISIGKRCFVKAGNIVSVDLNEYK